jgi:signal transduction histidine kinase
MNFQNFEGGNITKDTKISQILRQKMSTKPNSDNLKFICSSKKIWEKGGEFIQKLQNKFKIKIPPIIFVMIAVEVALVVTAFYFGDQIINIEKEETVTKLSNRATLIVNNVENQIDSATNIIEVTSTLPVVKNTDYSDYISEKYKGIPDTFDLKKRTLAKQILKTYPTFEFITFHMPNGDFYLMEPYADQLNLTRLNFADRDWYKGIMNTQITSEEAYVSEVYNSTTLKRNVVAIRAPVFDDNGTMIGIWGGSLKLQLLQESIENLLFEKNLQIQFYDQYGKKIFSAGTTDKPATPTIDSLVDDALSGKKNTVFVDDVIVSYSPINVGSNNWGLVMIQPQSDAFFSTTITEGLIIFMVTVFSVILGLAGYFVFRITQKNIRLIKNLEDTATHKDEFSAMISHELKTPLFPIIGYCKMLSKKNLIGNLNEDQLQAVDAITRNIKRLEKLIVDILDARKLDLDKMRFAVERFSLSEFLAKIESNYKSVLAEKEIQFTVNFAVAETTISTDENRLRQVFDNLIDNAVKFAPKKNGKISVSAKIENNLVLFSISDNGVGIPIEKQSELFHKFYQIDTSLKRNSQGSGLGLAICRGIIEAMGGTIWVESDGKSGTTFYFNLPLN